MGRLVNILTVAAYLTVLIKISYAKVTVCYYTNWSQYRQGAGVKFLPENIDANLCSHIVYSFAQINETTHLVSNYEWNDDVMISRVMKLKLRNPNLKVIISIGGWNHEKLPRYSNMVKTKSTRRIFINSAMKYMRKHEFDGLDIDWEYPGRRGSPPEDKRNYTILLQEIQGAFRDANETYILTASVGARRDVIADAYEIQEIRKQLDWINLMTYDLHAGNTTGHPTAMTGILPNVNDSLHAWIEGGMPSSQITLGLATYGITYTLESISNSGLGAPITGKGRKGIYTKHEGILSYYEICSTKWTSKTSWDVSDARAPYASKADQWVGYETPSSLYHKVAKLVKGKQLHGIAVWALDLDDFDGKFCDAGEYPLVKAAVKAMEGSDTPSLQSRLSPNSIMLTVPFLFVIFLITTLFH